MRTQRPSLEALIIVVQKLPVALKVPQAPKAPPFPFPYPEKPGQELETLFQQLEAQPMQPASCSSRSLIIMLMCSSFQGTLQSTFPAYRTVPQEEQWKPNRAAHLTFEDWSQYKVYLFIFYSIRATLLEPLPGCRHLLSLAPYLSPCFSLGIFRRYHALMSYFLT